MIKRIESGIAGKGLRADYLSSIEKIATNLGLKGIVFIKDDGSIKIIAEGEEENLEELTRKLERGHFFSNIENFYINWYDSTGEYENFSIIQNK